MKLLFFLALALFLEIPAVAEAQPDLAAQVEELKKIVSELQQTVTRQQAEINSLKSAQPAVEPAAAMPPAPAGPPPSATRGRWNPDIGVIADTVLKLDSAKTDTNGSDRISVREAELVMGSAVDPYSRFDASLGFSDLDEFELSEAYLTRYGLPLGATARVGRFKPKVGKSLSAHRDIIETVDYPLVIRRYFGEDGLHKTGLDLTAPLDLPVDSSHEIIMGVTEGGGGENGLAFGDARRQPTVYSHLRNFWDINDTATFELGATHMTGSEDADSSFETHILGLDGTYLYLFGPDRRLKLQSELFYLNNDEAPDKTLWGLYTLTDVRFHKQWSAGFRYDHVDDDNGYTGYLTFHQTEFARWRFQATHTDIADGEDDDQVLVQGIFSIGEHKHKLA